VATDQNCPYRPAAEAKRCDKKQVTLVPVGEILRQHNISKATYFHWRAKYAELALENQAIKDVLSRKR